MKTYTLEELEALKEEYLATLDDHCVLMVWRDTAHDLAETWVDGFITWLKARG